MTYARLACLLLFCFCGETNARNASSIVDAVAQSLPAAGSSWQLQQKYSNPRDDGSIQANIQWTNGIMESRATVIVHRTLKSARRAFRRQGKSDPQESLGVSGIGDEASLWPPKVLAGGAYNMRFRKARTEVWVSAASRTQIERIATVIASAIPPDS
jgi:hypothetical protein